MTQHSSGRQVALASTVLGLALGIPGAEAVEKGQFGLVAQLHAQRSIGVAYHPTLHLAVRPSFFFQRDESENVPALVDATQDIPVYETTETVFGGACDLLYFLRPQRDLAPYVGLVLSYAHFNEPYAVRSPGQLLLRNGNLVQASGSAAFGVQYAFTEHFHVYSHAAVGYVYRERFAIDGIRLKTSSWATGSTAVGAIFYFK